MLSRVAFFFLASAKGLNFTGFLDFLEALERLERLENLEKLEPLDKLEKLGSAEPNTFIFPHLQV